MNTYYEITAKIDEQEEVLFGSFEKSDCTYELEAEKEGWKAEGFKSIKITSRKTEEAPDTEVYDLGSALLINGLRWGKTERNSIYYCEANDRYARIEGGEIVECGTLEEVA